MESRADSHHVMAQPEMDVISLRDLFETLLRNVRLLVIFIVSFLVIGLLVAYFRAPVYQSEALVKVAKANHGGGMMLAALASLGGMGGGTERPCGHTTIYYEVAWCFGNSNKRAPSRYRSDT